MIISRTPFRISFVGGGTDLPDFYHSEEGRVLSTTIDKYIYVCVKRQIDIVEHKFKVSWRKVEQADKIDDIEHPIVRETLRLLKIDFPVEITTFADVPANTGLGSSSAFAVGLLHALFALTGQGITKHKLASIAAEIEIDILGRNIGKQDHFAAAYGNLNVLTFRPDGRVVVDPVFYNPGFKRAVESNFMLFYTALKRDASDVLREQKDRIEEKREVLCAIRDLVEPLREAFATGNDPATVGEILHKGWLLKRSLTGRISSGEIDTFYERARKAGAVGGKLLGAGGGGFLLFYVDPSCRKQVAEALAPLYQLPFRFDDGGSRITYYDER